MECPKKIPLAKTNVFSSLWILRKHGLFYFLNYHVKKQGYFFRMKIFTFNNTMLAQAEHVEHFKKHSKLYQRAINTSPLSVMRVFLGDGLITTEGKCWQEARESLQPIFQQDNLKQYTGDIIEITKCLLGKYSDHANVDMANDMNELTLAIIKKILFGESFVQNDLFVKIIRKVSYYFKKLMTSPFPKLTYFLNRKKIKLLNNEIDNYISDLIAKQNKNIPRQMNSVLNSLLAIKSQETGNALTPKQIRDHIMTLLLAGFETTANLITWTFYYLDKYPKILREILVEIDTVLKGTSPTFDDLKKLPKIDALIKESLRLAPTAPLFSRQTQEEIILGECIIPDKTDVVFAPFFTHRHPKLWKNPEQFDIHRFLNNVPEKGSYLPFGVGGHVCIGSKLAKLEAALILITFLQQYTFKLEPNFKVVPEISLTLYPKYGLRMIAHQRKEIQVHE